MCTAGSGESRSGEGQSRSQAVEDVGANWPVEELVVLRGTLPEEPLFATVLLLCIVVNVLAALIVAVSTVAIEEATMVLLESVYLPLL